MIKDLRFREAFHQRAIVAAGEIPRTKTLEVDERQLRIRLRDGIQIPRISIRMRRPLLKMLHSPILASAVEKMVAMEEEVEVVRGVVDSKY